jgi:hypothetical protein
MRFVLITISLILVCLGCGVKVNQNMRQHAVRFMLDGELMVQISVNEGASIGARRFPSPPIRQGYGFAGWSVESDGTRADFFADSIVPENLTVHGIWMKEIFSASELEAIRDNLDGNYILTDDITLFDWGWEPIGSQYEPFTGILDGAGHSIINLGIKENTGKSAVGLFGAIKDAEIRNLKIDSAIIEFSHPGTSAGIIAGIMESSLVYKCTVSGIVKAATSAGGFAGATYDSYILASIADVEVSAANAGGFVGSAAGSFMAVLQSSGLVNAGGVGGGIIGVAEQTRLRSSYSSSDVEARTASGGIVGSLRDSTVSGVYAIGSVSTLFGGFNAGGIAGDSYGSSVVEYSLAASKNISGARTARISPSAVAMLNNYAYTGIEMPHSAVSDINGADGENTSLNVNRNFFTGADGVNKLNWDFNKVWRLPDNLPDSQETEVLPIFIRGLHGSGKI